MDMDKITLRNRIGSIPVIGDSGGCEDNIAIALASYFSGHTACPDDDPIDTELGWGAWVLEKTNDALDRIVAELVKAKEG